MNRTARNTLQIALLGLAVGWVGCSDSERDNSLVGSDDLTMQPAGKGAVPTVPGRYIVVLEDGLDADAVGARARGAAARYNAQAEHVYTRAVRGFSLNGLSQAAAAQLANEPGVRWVEQDRVWSISKPGNGKGPGGGGGDGGGGSNCQAETVPWGITRVGGSVDMSGSSKRAFVIDSGINPVDDLNLDANLSRNFVTRGRDNGGRDGNGHGTHVAGTIAAIDNDCDVVGVAAGATVVAVRVLDNQGSGYTSWITAGIDYVASVGNPGDVANMSLGGSGSSATMENAVQNAAAQGIAFSLAAGNSSADANNYTPARTNGPNIYTVSATDINDDFAYFSNYGNPPVDYAAPGVDVESLSKDGGTVVYSGTSMAAPHVAGLLLLGPIQTDGFVNSGDPDGTPDPIAHR
jgi:subtilisin family serine protease